MENTLIRDNFEELMKLNKEDRELVMSYLETWTESYPPEFPDGQTLSMKIESQFETYLKTLGINEDDVDMFEVGNEITEHSSYVETDIQCIIDTWKGEFDKEFFSELIENNLVESE